MRKTNLPKLIHFGELRRDNAASSKKASPSTKKQLMIWGFISATDVECSCLKDPDYQSDMVELPEHVKCHQNMAFEIGDMQMEQQCGVKFKGKVFGISFKTKITQCHEHHAIPTTIRTGFAVVPSSVLKSDVYDPKQSKLSFGEHKKRTVSGDATSQHPEPPQSPPSEFGPTDQQGVDKHGQNTKETSNPQINVCYLVCWTNSEFYSLCATSISTG